MSGLTLAGAVRGQAIAPLYRSVPQAANNDPELYALLSLIDARSGRSGAGATFGLRRT